MNLSDNGISFPAPAALFSRMILFILLLLFVLVFGSCGRERGSGESRSDSDLSVTPETDVLFSEPSGDTGTEPDQGTSGVAAEGLGTLLADQAAGEPKVQLPERAVLLNTLDINLDLDRNEEQLIVIKGDNSPDSAIRLIVADYDTLRDGYVTAWEGTTASTQRRFFSVSVNDLIGDHNLEIVATGVNSRGEQTVDLFRRGGGNRFGLSYGSILSLAVKGTVTIEEHERSQAYLNGLKNGESFPVKSLVEEAEERVSRLYAWRSTEGRYSLVQEERTPVQEIEDQKLRDLFNDDVGALIDFLSGAWSNGSGATIYLDTNQEEITLYSGDIQEVYHWTSRYRFLSNSVSLKGENELIPYMHIEVAIRIRDLNTIELTLYDIDSHNGRRSLNNNWSGTYFLSPIGRGSGFSTAISGGEELLLPRLSGFFQGESGEELYLDPPNFSLEKDGVTRQGGFAVYMVDVPVFEFKFIGKTGVVEQQRAYRLVYREEQNDERAIRRLILVPGRIGVNGFILLQEEQELRFRQVEYFSTEE